MRTMVMTIVDYTYK